MEATANIARRLPTCKSATEQPWAASSTPVLSISKVQPRNGVITLGGYGISVRVDRGHLCLDGGVGHERMRTRLPRVGHGLKRLVVIGADGLVSLSAMRWLADQDASFIMLDRDGSVLATTGHVRSSDAKLRRAQAMALQNGTAFRVSRELVDRKLAGQQRVAIESLGDDSAGLRIRQLRSEIAEVDSVDNLRLIESQAAKAYWTAWRTVAITFPRKDLPHVPDHWLAFGSRVSSLTGSPRLATNPANAMLNYLYAVLEAESRLALATLGLDPGIGVFHLDARYRDSLACDVMEPIRPEVDAFVLNWLKREPLPRTSFFEERNGNCRLMDSLASKLSQTAPTWARLVAPVAEWLVRQLHNPNSAGQPNPPARLTQRYRREVKGRGSLPEATPSFDPMRLCRGCGKELASQQSVDCLKCSEATSVARIREAAHVGRVAALSADAQAKRSATQQVNARARWEWNSSDQPSWLTAQFYSEKIQPTLRTVSGSMIAKALNVSRAYANELRKGRLPHPRHWRTLAEFTGIRA